MMTETAVIIKMTHTKNSANDSPINSECHFYQKNY